MSFFIELIRESTKRLIIKAHFFLFKAPPGEITKRLLRNLSFAFFGVGAATLITFGVNILAVRFLGPEEFGKVNLIGSIGEFMAIPILWGLSVSVLRYLGAEREKKDVIIGSSLRIVVSLSLLSAAVFFILAPFIQEIFKIPKTFYGLAVLYAVVVALFYLFQSFFQGLEKFKRLSFIWISSAFVFVGFVLVYLFYLRDYSFEALFFGNIARLLLVILVGLIFFRKFLHRYEPKVAKKLFHYGTYQMLSVLAGFFALSNIDNLMINYFLGASAVGLYSAYQISFNIFIGKILSTFSQVFLPTASRSSAKTLFDKTLLLTKKGFVIVVLGNLTVLWILFELFGPEFSFDIKIALVVSLSTTIYFFRMIFGNILISRGIAGVKFGPSFASANALLNVLFNLLLIPPLGIFGAALATLLTSVATCLLPIYVLKKYFYNQSS